MAFNIAIQQHDQDAVIHLTDTATGTQAEIFAFGAMLNALVVNDARGSLNVIDGFTDPAHARASFTDGFKSVKLSPYVCRMHHGTYIYQGKEFTVNGPYLNEHAIHGLLCDALFEVKDQGADANKAFVTLHHAYQGQDAGYPFPYSLTVTWTLLPGRQLQVQTTAIHHHPDPIPFSDGWHPYFTTGSTVDEATLRFTSNKMVVFDDTLIPTGEIVPDTRFTNGQLMAGIELDNCFALEKDALNSCSFGNERITIHIHPDSSYPYLQVYTPPHRKSIAIENLSSPPDAFNNGIDLIWLQPGEAKTFTTSYQIGLK